MRTAGPARTTRSAMLLMKGLPCTHPRKEGGRARVRAGPAVAVSTCTPWAQSPGGRLVAVASQGRYKVEKADTEGAWVLRSWRQCAGSGYRTAERS